MKAFIYLFLLLFLMGCSSKKAVVQSEAKAPKYSSYQYKNKLIRTLPRVITFDESVEVRNQLPEGNSAKATVEKIGEPATELHSEGPKQAQPKFFRKAKAPSMPSDTDEVEDYKMATKAGGTGLMLAVLGLILAVVALFGNISIVFGLAIIALLAGFVFSLIGLKGGKRKHAIIGLIVSGIPIALGILALILYLIRE